ncbi:Aspartic proteinase CDR1 [Quillaja saponaria]|uniref:Aspartic proteinase CDR1 n=1 Tax=Quillaja saponaria TaxID=32244 RepID=A0AAD7PCG2_QUISA|nr:Aspartic proteinase CDR1 [Quillaja saponaria]
MTNTATFHTCFVIASILSISLLCLSTTKASNEGFSVELIRHDHPSHSPLMNKAFGRFMRQFNEIDTAQSAITAGKGHHLMKVSFGNPPQDIYGIIDTGSDLVWAQCLPCDNCYKQINPKFDPQKSSTFKEIPCDKSKQCHQLDTAVCSSSNVCNYTYGYGGGSLTQGVLAQEAITFTSTQGQPISYNIVFGCGHNNTGTFNDQEMGLIGLGGGPISLISQLGDSIGGKKFSHCLTPFYTDPHITSKMSFGSGSEVLGDGVVSTTLVAKQDKTPYFVTLEGISVGNTLVPFNNSTQTLSKGNMFIDSGTPPIILPEDFYNRLVVEVRNQIQMEPIENDPELGPQLCYKTDKNLEGPILTAHFDGGADVELTPTQTFIPPPKDGVFCLSMTNTTSDVGIYGNFAQVNYLIGFDLDKGVVSFKQTDCTKQ